MCSVSVAPDFNLQTIYFCHNEPYNLIDPFGFTIFRADNDESNNTYFIDQLTYDIVGINKDDPNGSIKPLVLYDQLVNTDGITFASKYFSFFTVNLYTNYVSNLITNMRFYEIGTHTSALCDMLFLDLTPKDNFNVVNVSMYIGQIGMLFDYINNESMSDVVNVINVIDIKKVTLKTPNVDQALREAVGKCTYDTMLPPKQVLYGILMALKESMPKRYTEKSISYDTLEKCILTLPDHCPNVSNGYKSAINCSNYRNFINSVIKNGTDDIKTKTFRDILTQQNESINTNISYYKDLVLLKYEILMSKLESKNVLDMNYYNLILGFYVNKILQKGTQARLFPISIDQIIHSLNSPEFRPNKKYINFRTSKHDTVAIIDTYYVTISDDHKFAGCGESCVYNYINKLLFDGTKLDIDSFPDQLRETELYKFYNDIFSSSETILEQNIAIQNGAVFNQFALLLQGINGINYNRSIMEFVPTAENFVKLLSHLFENILDDDEYDIVELTKTLYTAFNHKYVTITANDKEDKFSSTTLNIDNYRFNLSIGHCSTSSVSISYETFVPDDDSILQVHYFLSNLISYLSRRNINDPEQFDYEIDEYHQFISNINQYLLLMSSEDFCDMLGGEYDTGKGVIDITFEIKEKHVRNCPTMYEFMNPKYQTYKLCLDLVKKSGHLLQYVKKEFKTDEMYNIALDQSGINIEYIDFEDQTPERCLKAIKQSGYSIKYIDPIKLTPELCLMAIKESGSALEYVPADKQTPELCKIALKDGKYIEKFVKIPMSYQRSTKQYIFPSN